MSEPSKHTPEPWHRDYVDIYGQRRRIGNARDDGDDNLEALANAARIVACVNACAGINPEAVPDMLAALKELRDWYFRNVGLPAVAANAAIAKAEGRES